jgi:hypothetical protein
MTDKLSAYLDAVDARVSAATPGPWEPHDTERDLWDGEDYVFDGQGKARNKQGPVNLAFAAAARADVPRLLRLLRALLIERDATFALDMQWSCANFDSLADVNTTTNAVIAEIEASL